MNEIPEYDAHLNALPYGAPGHYTLGQHPPAGALAPHANTTVVITVSVKQRSPYHGYFTMEASMGDVVNFPLARHISPTVPEGDPELSVNLDAVGTLGALLCQLAALEAVSDLPPGARVKIVREGTTAWVTSDEVSERAEQLMDAKDDLIADLGLETARRALRACLISKPRLYGAT